MSDTKRNMGRGDDKLAPQKKKLRKNHLLVIGIDKYQNGISPLNNAVRDAKAFKSILLEKYQFTAKNVKELYNETATKDAILDAFDYYWNTLTDDDNLIIYFSGHGEIHQITQKGYWIPVDAKLGTRASYLSNNEVADFYKYLKAHHVFGIVDSCFSGALFSTRKLTSRSEQLDNIPSRWLLTAGRKELVSDGSLGDNSPFAKSLITQLKYNEENALRVSKLCDNVLDGVKFNTNKQTPRGEPLQNVGHQGGQFVFYAKNFEPLEADTASDRQPIDPFPTRDTLDEPIVKETQRKGLSFNTFPELQFELKKKMVDGLEEAFDEIEKVLDPSSKKSMDLIMAKARHSEAMRNQNLGIATQQQINLTMNQIRAQLAYLIDKMEVDDLKEELRKQLVN
ncbi:MAG TPA: caspase family protein [Saprospiraceae bacterium]|nr:caspase family protein [Saprospiraceae bacterium]